MQKRKFTVLELPIILLFGLNLILWANSGVGQMSSREGESVLDFSQEGVVLGKSYSVPRDRVLMELFTSTG